jgi:hypothetical protein
MDAKQPMVFSEGSAPRDLLRDDGYRTFFEADLSQYEALLLMIPPPLKHLTFPAFEGAIHRLVIPGQVVHETYRVVVPAFLGLLEHVCTKHNSVCILTQSAVLAPLAAIMLELVADQLDATVSFFDLGRVLDVVHPDSIRSYPSLSWVTESGLLESLEGYLNLDEALGNYGVVRIDYG